jgi:hypothetical protein
MLEHMLGLLDGGTHVGIAGCWKTCWDCGMLKDMLELRDVGTHVGIVGC